MDRNVKISLSERIRSIMDDVDEISMMIVGDNSNISYDLSSAYSDLRTAYLKSKKKEMTGSLGG